MRTVNRKLNGDTGASLLLALLFLLLCLTVGAVILTAASANVGRYTHERTQQQAYLTASSAANLIRQRLSGLEFSAGEQEVTDEGSVADSLLPSHFSSTDAFPGIVNNMARQVFLDQTIYLPPSGALPVAVPLTITPDEAELEGVYAQISMDDHYNLTISFSLSGSLPCPLVLTLPADVEDHTVSEVTTYETTEDVDGVPTQVTHSMTTATRTVTVTWSGGIIVKGDGT